MQANQPTPTIKEIQQIIDINDPIIRNLQITHCYHELLNVLTRRTGLSANWCAFATWASKQAGQTIRKEDLARLLENHDPTPDSPLDSGAVDWVDLPDRIHFIIGFFSLLSGKPGLVHTTICP